MDKKIFNMLKKVCKDEWKRLAKTGDGCKSDAMRIFYNQCPACHIASDGEKQRQDCRLCPIDVWRELADLETGPEYFTGQAVCGREGELYRIWAYSFISTKDRKRVAAKIAKLKWSWLPEYDKIMEEEDA